MSEQIGKVLMDCGIPRVIYIKRKDLIPDKLAMLFGLRLIKELLSGVTVSKAFKAAKSHCS